MELEKFAELNSSAAIHNAVEKGKFGGWGLSLPDTSVNCFVLQQTTLNDSNLPPPKIDLLVGVATTAVLYSYCCIVAASSWSKILFRESGVKNLEPDKRILYNTNFPQ